MGFLNGLIASSSRFKTELLPAGYEQREIAWVINLDPSGKGPPVIQKKQRGETKIAAPDTPADRTSGKISPCLLVDKISYVSGRPDADKKGNPYEIANHEHMEFISLLCKCFRKTKIGSLRSILRYLTRASPYLPEARPSDLCAFQVGASSWETDDENVQQFWSNYVQERLGAGKRQCSLCGIERAITRILPFRAKVFKYRVQLCSFNKDAFCSHGGTTKSAMNGPVCYECASTAAQVLQFLLRLDEQKESGRHAVVLARDERQALGNQIAVFWTKEQVKLESKEVEKKEFEYLAKAPIEEFDEIPEDAAPAKVGQCRALLELPFAGGRDVSMLPANRFYLAVLSPNKSRLVVREWLETDITPVQENIRRYLEAVKIVHPDGRDVWWPPLRTMLKALRSYTSVQKEKKEKPRLPPLGPDVTRKLIRCIYTGTPPPEALLTRAVRCFRIPDSPTEDREQRGRQMKRRMAMAAAMKLVLTHDKDRKEGQAMEQLKTEHDAASGYKQQPPYNCGVLLAILEAIQRRASSSGRGLNTTVVDRFYGAASTAPATVFANLINMATKAHLPKLRREGKEFFKVRSQGDAMNISDLMTEACKAIDDAGGFPPPLRPEQQAQFALGFYHQRAELNPPKKQPKGRPTTETNITGGQV